MSKPELAQPSSKWTHVEAYVGGLAARRALRRSRKIRARTEPEAPRLILSTVPFAALIAVLGILIVAFAVAAWPGSQPGFEPSAAVPEIGTAAPGWLERAKKDMH
jgi:hypothetical protein